MTRQLHEPHKIKTVRLLAFPTPDEQKKNLADAEFNVFRLKPSQVTFDMCSDAMNALSQEQLSAQFLGDEAYAGARNFENLQHADVRKEKPSRLRDAVRALRLPR